MEPYTEHETEIAVIIHDSVEYGQDTSDRFLVAARLVIAYHEAFQQRQLRKSITDATRRTISERRAELEREIDLLDEDPGDDLIVWELKDLADAPQSV